MLIYAFVLVCSYGDFEPDFTVVIFVVLTHCFTMCTLTQAAVSCAPHFVVPGFMKAGTTYAFGTMVTHPMLLNTLRGVTFKETGCYGKQYTQPQPRNLVRTSLSGLYRTANGINQRAGKGGPGNESIVAQFTAAQQALQTATNKYYNRMDCFPFVEPSEAMRFGDGTVWYNSHKEIPAALLRDNPRIKVLFSIRHPVRRTESQHKFAYNTLARLYTGDLNEIVAYLLHDPRNQRNNNGSLVELRAQAVDILQTSDVFLKREKTEVLMENFQKKLIIDKKYKTLNQFIKFSIYFIPIYYWYKHIPTHNIAVLPVEVLQPLKLTEEVKLDYLRNLTTTEQYQAVLQLHDAAGVKAQQDLDALYTLHESRQQKAKTIEDSEKRNRKLADIELQFKNHRDKILKMKETVLNAEYLVQQYNRIFR